MHSAPVDGGLISFIGTRDTPAPYEVRVWTSQLDGKRLVATEVDQIQRMSPGRYPKRR